MKVKVITGRWEKRFRDYLYIGLGSVIGVALLGFVFYMTALRTVSLQVDGHSYQWRTINSDVTHVLKEKKIFLNTGDTVRPSLKTAITENLKIQVFRAFTVKIRANGQTKEFNTTAETVKKVLASAKITIDKDDKISPSLNTVVVPGQKIKVVKIDSKLVTKQITVKPSTEYYKDKDLERGAEKVVRQGQSGLVERQEKVVYEDGKEVDRYKVAEKTIQPVVNAVIARGIRNVVRTLTTSRGAFRYIEVKSMVATAYYPGPESCGKYAAIGQTYTGKKAGFGLVAVDPRFIKLGTILYIEGYGRAEAADIGGAIKGNRIDLCYETYREAAMYGTKNVKVYILEE
ncbi:MAG TPA: hypothetical protein DDW50_00815 [Firmicutes bacterium]|jgi:uncharacterized protein YabE (DUF348 family)|nr:hypothetical protein [Bacillota bacterium]